MDTDTVVDPFPANPGERIKAKRLEARLTQSELADAVGCTESYMSRIEVGDRTPSRRLLERLSDRLDCSIDWILRGDT